MEPAQWQQIERLYHAALTRPADERAQFLAEACAGDEPLRREVETLLASPTTDGIFARLALVVAGEVIRDSATSLLTGRRLGVYQLQERIGIGGMGEVYRARDTRLGRDVAIKILPSAFTNDPDRLARFEREARVLAALNHPNIATIHGIEESPSTRSGQPPMQALVMELVEGDTLAERIARGPIPVQDALGIARQIAEALDAAHEKGIIHRDLKPANVKIRPGGVIKVLDFGLAKIAGNSLAPDAPTITLDGTREGQILGTAAYMSPEQARGEPVDKRTDIWAFGCVLYEMLTGACAFAADGVSGTLARVLMTEPDWDALPEALSPSIRVFMRRCLQKNAKLCWREGCAGGRAVLAGGQGRISGLR